MIEFLKWVVVAAGGWALGEFLRGLSGSSRGDVSGNGP
jgi:hypothetical protein